MWEMLRKKDVLDVDGFRTEYTLYCDEERFVCVFGDSELYGPEDDSNWDFETESPIEAYEWFDAYGEEPEPDFTEGFYFYRLFA